MITKHMRPAIAMIELIFAIVVMGIVMMSAPMLLNTASKSGYAAIQQEGINEAATQVNIILGYQWDENNTQDEYDPVVLATSSAIGALEESAATPNLRAGTPKESFRKYISSTGKKATATAINWEENPAAKDDIDDFNGTSSDLKLEESGATSDYIEKTTINISRIVSYMSDDENGTGTYTNGGGGTLTFNPTFTDSSTSTNIKRIQVTLTSSSTADELEKTITLHAFSCNIGSYKLEERN